MAGFDVCSHVKRDALHRGDPLSFQRTDQGVQGVCVIRIIPPTAKV